MKILVLLVLLCSRTFAGLLVESDGPAQLDSLKLFIKMGHQVSSIYDTGAVPATSGFTFIYMYKENEKKCGAVIYMMYLDSFPALPMFDSCEQALEPLAMLFTNLMPWSNLYTHALQNLDKSHPLDTVTGFKKSGGSGDEDRFSFTTDKCQGILYHYDKTGDSRVEETCQ